MEPARSSSDAQVDALRAAIRLAVLKLDQGGVMGARELLATALKEQDR